MHVEKGPSVVNLFEKLSGDAVMEALRTAVDNQAGDRYLHWDKLRRLGRPLALLTDSIRHPEVVHTFESHAKNHRVSHETARADLRQLVSRHLLVQRRKGRKHIFEPAPDLPERLKESPA